MTEDERAEAARLWWSENGKYVVFGAILGIGSVLGWRGWEEYETRHARAAATLYYQMYDDLASQFSRGDAPDEEGSDEALAGMASTPTDYADASTAVSQASTKLEVFEEEAPEDPNLAGIRQIRERLKLVYKPEVFETLRRDYADTVYPAMAYLEVARVDIENGDLEKAIDKLNWVARTTTHAALKHIADIRRSRVLSALKRYDEALEVLRVNEFPEEMSYLVEEARGDALAGQGEIDAAAEAYKKAIKLNEQPGDFVKMKLDNLGLVARSSTPTSSE